MASITTEGNYDRIIEVKQFDESKIGVKGLVDSGVKTIPRFFHQPPENLPGPNLKDRPLMTIPVIDLSRERSTVVEEVKRYSSSLGFFQVINHSVPLPVIDNVVNDMKKFYEQPMEYKMQYYHRDAQKKGAAYYTNFDLYQSQGASWRDTFQVRLSPTEPEWDAVPGMCKAPLLDWDKAVVGLAKQLMSILSEGLGLKSDKLNEMLCYEHRLCASHYYPPCPEPELTIGIGSHTDPCVITLLVQNEIGNLLQVKCGEDWAYVEAVPGAIVINIGDLLQVLSNDEYKSVEHRVLANPTDGARVSVATFFNPTNVQMILGPFPELISAETPAAFKEFLFADYLGRFYTRELDGKTLVNFYRADNTKT
uniref:1-aminocyclopropane-1-carboxylate oxidase homolog 3-like n=1 Tax=Erigeron canadensis TaxID=72917 RepID=UPI001CB96A24|nr:1-aminocyclopropane-1-carboxylate oxidase homolog 3-like [Erigeron canadensis]